LSWWRQWLVALLALTAGLTAVFAMVAPFVVGLQGKKALEVGANITVV
jgi:hypothetical protein